jgi:predicted acyl esterase
LHRSSLRLRPLAALAAFAVAITTLLAAGPDPGADASTDSSLPFAGHGSIDQAYVVGATHAAHLQLVSSSGQVVGSGVVDGLGSLIVYNAAPGSGYRFRETAGPNKGATTSPFQVLSVHDTPPSSFYASQHLHAGLNYLTMRDGVKLAATLRLPPGKTLADGPFPTVIEDSGYAVAPPHSLINTLLSPSKTPDPLVPSTSTILGSAVAPLIGFATLSLQMRGTGCSGGAFDLFGTPSDYDGYDAVEITATQPWVAHHKVGLIGISYSGISQFGVAGTRPPALAAIAPLSPTDDLYSTGYPGGIYNDGFAKSWIADRVSDAKPAPQGGQPWASAEIATGDKQCLANQALHGQTLNIDKLLTPTSPRDPARFDQRSAVDWARHIDVPVFLVGALEDEQTGPQWPALITALQHDPHVWATMQNGTHTDSLGPTTITRWLEFLDLYVADKVPTQSSILNTLSGPLYTQLTGASAEPLPPVRFTKAPNVTDARAEWAANDPRVRVLFDNGGGSLGPGDMQSTWEADYQTWPPRQAAVTTLGLAPHGALATSGDSVFPANPTAKPAAKPAATTVSFEPDASLRPASTLTSSANAWAALPPYDWTPVTGTSGLGFVTAPLSHDVVVVGPASLNLRLKSSAADTDLQVTVSEVYPDGREMYVTSGFLRAGYRVVDAAASTSINPVHDYLRVVAMPKGKYVTVRIPIDPIAHAFRTGSRLRITISAPGGDRPEWAFDTPATHGKVVDTVALTGANGANGATGATGSGSTLALAVVPNLTPTDPPPSCPSLRGEPCRTYVPAANGG